MKTAPRKGWINQALAERIESGDMSGRKVVALALAANAVEPGLEWPDQARWSQYYEFGRAPAE